MQIESVQQPLTCECGRVFKTKPAFSGHIRWCKTHRQLANGTASEEIAPVDGKPRQYACECGNTYRFRQGLVNHQRNKRHGAYAQREAAGPAPRPAGFDPPIHYCPQCGCGLVAYLMAGYTVQRLGESNNGTS
jgi:hypothetical protein